MTLAVRLLPHPSTPNEAVKAIEVEAAVRSGSVLRFLYRVEGDIDALVMAAPTLARRADELWRHTCFEAFIAVGAGRYYELNFAPSGEWAAYSFTGYRRGRAPLELSAPPAIRVRRAGDRFELEASCAIAADGALPGGAPLAPSVVIEERSGRRSYWALRHPRDEPDFHHPEVFTITP